MKYFTALLLLLSFTTAHSDDTKTASPPDAQIATPDPAKAEEHRNKARVYVEQKDWQNALTEIQKSTQLNPNSPDAWLIHGTVAMRLEKNAEALDAFNKYLALNPPAEKVTVVKQRIAELEVRLEKQRKEEAEVQAAAAKAKAERFGPGGTGFFVGYSPVFQPKIGDSSDLNSTISKAYDFGFRFGNWDVGLKLGSGTVDTITVKDEDGVVIGTFSDGKHTFYELFMDYYAPMKVPEEGKAGSAFFIPIHFGGFMNNVKFDKTYGNMGFTLGTGGQFRYYSASHFVFDASALYNLGLPFWGIQNNDAEILKVYNANGQNAKGSMTGFELRLGFTILF